MKKQLKRHKTDFQEKNASPKFYLNDHWDFLFVGVILIAAFILRFNKITSYDNMLLAYLMMAKWIKAGLGFLGPDGLPHVVFPPVYPYLIVLASYFKSDLLIASKILNVLLGTLTIIPLFILIKDISDRWTGYIVIIIFATNSFLVKFSANSRTESSYTFFLILGICFGYFMLKKSSSFLGIFAGGFIALAYLTRPEGFVNLLILTAFAVLYIAIYEKTYKKQIINVCLIIIVFFLVSSPYIFFLQKHTGEWTLSNKAAYVLIAGKVSAGIGNWEEEYWGLNEEGTERKVLAEDMSLSEYLIKNPQEAYYRFRNGLKKEYETLNKALNLNKGVLVLTLIGLIAMIYKRSLRFYGFFFLSFFAPMLLSTVTRIYQEYLYPYLLLVIIFLAFGCVFLAGIISSWFIKTKFTLPKFDGRSISFLISLFIITLIITFFPLMESIKPPILIREDPVLLEAADWMKKNLPPKSTIMSRWLKIAYYSDLYWQGLPYAPYKKIITYANTHNVRYLFLGPHEWYKRPLLRSLFYPNKKIPEELRLVKVFPTRSQKIKYLLYEVKP